MAIMKLVDTVVKKDVLDVMPINAYNVKQDSFLLEDIVLRKNARKELFTMEKSVKSVRLIAKDVINLDALNV